MQLYNLMALYECHVRSHGMIILLKQEMATSIIIFWLIITSVLKKYVPSELVSVEINDQPVVYLQNCSYTLTEADDVLFVARFNDCYTLPHTLEFIDVRTNDTLKRGQGFLWYSQTLHASFSIQLRYEVCQIKGTVHCTVNRNIPLAEYSTTSHLDIHKCCYIILALDVSILLLAVIIFTLWKFHFSKYKQKFTCVKKNILANLPNGEALPLCQGKQTIGDDFILKQLIVQEKKVAIKVAVQKISSERPKYWPGENIPYPGQDWKDEKRPRKGSGRLHLYILFERGAGVGNDGVAYRIEKDTCDCNRCQKLAAPSSQWMEIYVLTAANVVYDIHEATHTSCQLCVSGQIFVLDDACGFVVDVESDRCILKYVKCDAQLRGILYNQVAA
ncbi:hypothetical protein Btru_043281 [Bulinus truncatus]|nr:hypothetical protein Btru_043281 [Bulinus truncatus]